jgi:hypothetical protein
MLRVRSAVLTSTRRQPMQMPPSRVRVVGCRAHFSLIQNAPLRGVSSHVSLHSRCLINTVTAEIEHDYKRRRGPLFLNHRQSYRVTSFRMSVDPDKGEPAGAAEVPWAYHSMEGAGVLS